MSTLELLSFAAGMTAGIVIWVAAAALVRRVRRVREERRRLRYLTPRLVLLNRRVPPTVKLAPPAKAASALPPDYFT